VTKDQRDRTGVHALAVSVATAMFAGCVAQSPEPEPAAIATSQLTSLLLGDSVPQACKQNRYCWFRPTTGSEADPSHFPLWGQLGCGPIYNFRNGNQFGHGAICVDSPDNRALLHSSKVLGLMPVLHCLAAPAISPCLELPAGEIFVDLDPIIPSPSPYCPSSCKETQFMEGF
jgi:hypothetical protein